MGINLSLEKIKPVHIDWDGNLMCDLVCSRYITDVSDASGNIDPNASLKLQSFFRSPDTNETVRSMDSILCRLKNLTGNSTIWEE